MIGILERMRGIYNGAMTDNIKGKEYSCMDITHSRLSSGSLDRKRSGRKPEGA